MAELKITIGQLNGINTSTDENPLFETETTTGNRSVSIDKLRLLLALSSKEVGKMHFRPYNGVSPLELPCDGQVLLKTDYPYLYEELGGIYGEDATTFTLPDLRDYPFPAHRKNDSEIGTNRDDTMRKILGKAGSGNRSAIIFDDLASSSSFSGVFNANPTSGPLTRGGGMKASQLIFDSSKGIEGQEGTVSPNVGQKTAPAHLIGVWAIRAKP